MSMNRALARSITSDEIHTFEEEGVVWLRGIIDPEWVRRLSSAIDDFLADPRGQAVDFTNLGLLASTPEQVSGFKAAGDWVEQKLAWGTPQQLAGKVLVDETVRPEEGKRGHYLSVTGTWRLHPTMSALAIASPLPEIAAVLMRSKKVYLYDDQLLVKPPGTMEKTAWHQDLGYDHIQGTKVCGIRVPTAKETEDMGPVLYLRRSHKSGKIFKVNYFISDAVNPLDEGEAIPKIDGYEAEFDTVYFLPEPGDVVVHHLATLHGAGGNRSTTSSRRAVTYRYGGDDATHKFRRFAPPQDVSALRDREPLDKDPDRHPVVWPR
jgi:ectoine hydroxylase-related dioxygenase (phytanoyl-CoA dioxygenase family)